MDNSRFARMVQKYDLNLSNLEGECIELSCYHSILQFPECSKHLRWHQSIQNQIHIRNKHKCRLENICKECSYQRHPSRTHIHFGDVELLGKISLNLTSMLTDTRFQITMNPFQF